MCINAILIEYGFIAFFECAIGQGMLKTITIINASILSYELNLLLYLVDLRSKESIIKMG